MTILECALIALALGSGLTLLVVMFCLLTDQAEKIWGRIFPGWAALDWRARLTLGIWAAVMVGVFLLCLVLP